MGYSFIHVGKIKCYGTMTSKYNHNLRKVEVANAIPEAAHKNCDLVSLPVVDGRELTYREAFKERIKDLPVPPRSNSVLGYEVLMTYSRDPNVNPEEWRELSMKWLAEKFNVAGDGKSNIIHAVYHADEVGNPHIHAFVTPVDERGRLCARTFTGSQKKMRAINDEYAKSVECLGLKRGVYGSSAKHEDVSRLYANINNAIKIPDVLPGETAEQYRTRVADGLMTQQAAMMKRQSDMEVAMRQSVDQSRFDQQEEIELSYRQSKNKLKHETSELKREVRVASEQVVEYQEMVNELLDQMYDIKTEEAKKAIETYKNYQAGAKALSQQNPEYIDALNAMISDVCEIGKNEQHPDIEISH